MLFVLVFLNKETWGFFVLGGWASLLNEALKGEHTIDVATLASNVPKMQHTGAKTRLSWIGYIRIKDSNDVSSKIQF